MKEIFSLKNYYLIALLLCMLNSLKPKRVYLFLPLLHYPNYGNNLSQAVTDALNRELGVGIVVRHHEGDVLATKSKYFPGLSLMGCTSAFSVPVAALPAPVTVGTPSLIWDLLLCSTLNGNEDLMTDLSSQPQVNFHHHAGYVKVIDLGTQLEYYKKVETWLRNKLGNAEAKARLSRAVYLFSIGSDDHLSLFLTNSTMLNYYNKSQYIGMVIGNLTSAIKDIHTRGGRKFGFINSPDGCSPGLRIIKPENNGSCLEEVTSLEKLHNRGLSKLLIMPQTQLKGFKYSLCDLSSNLRKRMKHPHKYGKYYTLGSFHVRIVKEKESPAGLLGVKPT
ncbi:hypothetical protein FNV43_RR00650 [Rhamnella rubrinervis]|uniref:Uncharacterized protein n=1 Tax=Rhamnella rubrinervis TaxID=2594499 RepID=A0A8K0MRL3_9ROSA|nr:hypothetical protein FNV43_RR00650 [Rhamnella rubrinervis]